MSDVDLLDFPYDRAAAIDLRDQMTPQKRGTVSLRDITYSNSLGGRVSAYLVTPPESGRPPYAAVLWAHWLEPETTDSNRTQFLSAAIELAGEGVVSILPDCFWSTTPKKWAEHPIFWWKSDAKHDTDLSVRQVVELRRSLDVLVAQPGVDPQRLGYVGHDFGGMYGALVAAVDRRPKFYVMMAVTTTFSEWFLFGSKLSKEDESKYIDAMAPLDPKRYVAKAAPARLYMQFAHADFYVPERTGQMFFDAASEPKEVSWYDAGHDVRHDEAEPDRMRWIRKQIGPSSAPLR